jgi:hypothetical protein
VSGGGRQRPYVFDQFAARHAHKAEASILPRAYGVARLTEGKVTSQAIVVASAPLDVKSFSKTYAPGAPFSLEVRPRDAFTDLTLFVDNDAGTVDEERLLERPDGAFFVSRAVPSRPGRYFVEIQGTEPSAQVPTGEQRAAYTLLLVPLYVGVPEPSEPEKFIREPSAGQAAPAAWPVWVMGMYDAQRARFKKAPLVTDARLTAMAERRAAIVADAPGDSTPERGLRKKLEASGLSFRELHWKTTTFETVADFMYGHLLSPALRKRVVLPDQATHAVGIAPRLPDERGRVRYVVVEYTLIP